MDLAVALIAGAAAKIYDDGVDTGLLTDEYQKKILETLQCFLLGILSVNNFMFTVIMYTINLIAHLFDEEAFKNPYENSLIIVYPIFFILSFQKRKWPTCIDAFITIILSLVAIIETSSIKENTSPRKAIIRFLTIIFLACIYYITISHEIQIFTVYFIGYMIVSTIFQIYSVSHMPFADFVDEAIDGFKDLFSSLSLSLSPSLNVTAA